MPHYFEICLHNSTNLVESQILLSNGGLFTIQHWQTSSCNEINLYIYFEIQISGVVLIRGRHLMEENCLSLKQIKCTI